MKTISTIISSCVIGIISLVGVVFLQVSIYATEIRLGIYNSYQGSLTIQPGENTIPSGGITRTNENILGIIIGANTGSSYTITGAGATISHTGSNIYTHNYNLTLQSTDGSQTLYGAFMRDTEPYGTTLNLMIDRSAPSIPFLLQPITNSVVSSDINLSRSPSIDNGIGLSHYRVHLSLDAGFAGETILVTSGTSLYINSNDLPIGTLFWYIEAIDYLGNNSNSAHSFFHNQTYSIIDNEPTDGGGAGIGNINSNNNSGVQAGNTIQSGSIGQSGSVIEHNSTGDNTIIITPDTDNNPIIHPDTFSGNIIENNTINTPTDLHNDTPISKENNGSSSSSYDPIHNYIIVSNSINNTVGSLKEYLIHKYQSLGFSQRGNFIPPTQNIITHIIDQKHDIYSYYNMIKKAYMGEGLWIHNVITYIIQQYNPVYYMVKMIEFSFMFITKPSPTLGL